MTTILKAHLVFSDIDKKLLGELSKYCQITGINSTLDDAVAFSSNIIGVNPDLIIINGADYFEKNRTYLAIEEFIIKISIIKTNQTNIRIILLLPEKLFDDLKLIKKLIELELYDFWFFDSFDEEDIIKFMFNKRALIDIEEYLHYKGKAKDNKKDRNFKVWNNIQRIYQPYYVKSKIIAFYSEDDSLLNYGLAVLTAFELAGYGFKVALVETVNTVPRLASILSLVHPYFNTRHAVTMYIQKNNDFIKDCLFNKDIYLGDQNSPHKNSIIENYPPDLYLLPDGINKESINLTEIERNWQEFIIDFTRLTIFEKGFNFLIFICQGNNDINNFVLNNIANLQYITINMLPGSIAYGINERKKDKGKVHLVGSKNIKYISGQLNEIEEAPFLYAPDSFANDFLEFVYLKKKKNITSEDSKKFINQIVATIGVKPKEKIEKEGLGKIKKFLNI